MRVDLAVPSGRIVVNRVPPEGHAHENLHVANRDVFDAARRHLRGHMSRLDGVRKAAPEQ